MNDELPKKWVGGICIQEGKVLLIHRINKERLFNQEYFVFPGKEVEDDENIEEAIIDVYRNIGLTVRSEEVLYSNEDIDTIECYYRCKQVLGEIETKSVQELENETQFFTPMWVSLEELDDLVLYPESIKELLIENKLR